MKQCQGLYEFVAVAEALSFKQAAEHLGLSSAQVSRQISSLEQRLGSKLLYRSTRQVSLTEMGAIYYHHCRQVLEQLDEAERAISQQQTEPRGLLRVTAPATYGEQVIAPLLNLFAAQHTDLTLWLQFSNEMTDMVHTGIDMGIRIGTLPDSTMMARRLANRKLYLIASPDYLALHGTPCSIEQLVEHSCLTHLDHPWRLSLKGKELNYKPTGKISTNSGYALLQAALQGLGIAQLPDFYLSKYLASGQLVSVLADNQPEEDGIWAIYPHNRHLSPKVRSAVDFLCEHIKDSVA
ncbi:LysR substrate-binding domain-containing protein [Shewanella baltica]|uniref:LysR substrate-binding domain-containing protein n=1 Tax=Shewanella baltica TaxID=62322 RepID=UPI0032185F9A